MYAKCLRNLSCDLHAAGDPAKAASASRHAIQLLKSLPNHTEADIWEIRGTLSNLMDQCLAMNDYPGAATARGELEQIDRALGLS